LGDEVEFVLGRLEIGIVGRGSVHEQLNCFGRSRSVSLESYVEPSDTPNDFAGDPEWFPSRDEDRDRRTGGQPSLHEGGARADQMLAVVEDDEGTAGRQEPNGRGVEIGPMSLGQVHRGGSGGYHQIGIGNRRQIDEPDPVWAEMQ
jgi:hypothetical protein